jgi:hypothetical protein
MFHVKLRLFSPGDRGIECRGVVVRCDILSPLSGEGSFGLGIVIERWALTLFVGFLMVQWRIERAWGG